jgi:hypothetical protein
MPARKYNCVDKVLEHSPRFLYTIIFIQAQGRLSYIGPGDKAPSEKVGGKIFLSNLGGKCYSNIKYYMHSSKYLSHIMNTMIVLCHSLTDRMIIVFPRKQNYYQP